MKTKIIQMIIRDKARVLPLLVLLGTNAVAFLWQWAFNVDFPLVHQATVTSIITLIFGWFCDGYALNQTAEGVKRSQRMIGEEDDGYAGPVFTSKVEGMVVESVVNKPPPDA